MTLPKILSIVFLVSMGTGFGSHLDAQKKNVQVKIISNGSTKDSTYTVSYTSGKEGEGKQKFVTVMRTSSDMKGSNKDSIIELTVNASGPDDMMEEGQGNIVMITRSGNGEENEQEEMMNEDGPANYFYQDCDPACCKNDSCKKKSMRMKVYFNSNDSMHGGRHHRFKYFVTNDGMQGNNWESQMDMIPPTNSNDTSYTHISPMGDTIKIHRKVMKDGKIQQEVTVNSHRTDTAGNKFFKYRMGPGHKNIYMRRMPMPGNGDHDFAFDMQSMPPLPGRYGDMKISYDVMNEGIDEKADFGKIKVVPLEGKDMVRISLDLSGKENTTIKILDEKGKIIFEEKIKDLTGKYVRDIDMTGNPRGKYSFGLDRGKSTLSKQFSY